MLYTAHMASLLKPTFSSIWETAMDLMFKLPVLVVLGFIVFSLAQGMYYLAKDDGETDKNRVVRALTVRIVLSLTLFGLLILGYVFGLIEPHGV
ncbi:MAG: twin transmembrane helix small protein [Chromatiaceae bacterium]